MQGVSSMQETAMGTSATYCFMRSSASGDTSEITCSSASGLPAMLPAAMAGRMPLSPPVFGTTTLFTFFKIFPLTSALTVSGRAPSVSLSLAAA